MLNPLAQLVCRVSLIVQNVGTEVRNLLQVIIFFILFYLILFAKQLVKCHYPTQRGF